MEPIVIFLLICVITYSGLFLIHIILKTRKLEKLTRHYYYGIAFFLLMFITYRSIFLINDLYFLDSIEHVLIYDLLYIFGNFTAAMAVFGIMFVVERYIYTKLHYIPSAIIIISAILIIALPETNGMSLITYYSIIAAVMAALIPIMYIIVGLRVSGDPRKRSFLLALGLIIFMISVLTYSDAIQGSLPALKIISPLLTFVGIGIFHYALLFFSQMK